MLLTYIIHHLRIYYTYLAYCPDFYFFSRCTDVVTLKKKCFAHNILIKSLNETTPQKYVIYALICRQKVLIFPEVREIACVIFTPIPVFGVPSFIYLKKAEKQWALWQIYQLNGRMNPEKYNRPTLYPQIFFSALFLLCEIYEQSQKSVFYFLILQTRDDKKK